MGDIPTDNVTFEQALTDLEGIVRALEDGTAGLEESLAQYERGVGLLKRCYNQLQQAEQRILLLAGEGAEGQPLVRPFEHAPALDAAPTDGRRRRKKSED